MKKIKHKDYLVYKVPSNWVVEDCTDSTSIYCNHGEGAITLSFHAIFELQGTLVEHISMMAKRFVDGNKIALDRELVLDETKNKIVLYGEGISPDNWYIKLWLIARYPKIVLATYISEQKTAEVKKVDKIISSFTFLPG